MAAAVVGGRADESVEPRYGCGGVGEDVERAGVSGAPDARCCSPGVFWGMLGLSVLLGKLAGDAKDNNGGAADTGAAAARTIREREAVVRCGGVAGQRMGRMD